MTVAVCAKRQASQCKQVQTIPKEPGDEPLLHSVGDYARFLKCIADLKVFKNFKLVGDRHMKYSYGLIAQQAQQLD